MVKKLIFWVAAIFLLPICLYSHWDGRFA